MTVETAVKGVEGEKCGLDMSTYEDMHSSANVGGNGGDNGDIHGDGNGKDDYVFVNDSDMGLEDDHGERNENGEVSVVESSVDEGGRGDQLGIGNVESDRLDNGVREDGGESKVENGGVDVVEEKENGEIEADSEVVEEVDNGRSESNVDLVADVGDKVVEEVEGSVSKPVDEVRDEETAVENHYSGNGSVDGSQSADVGDEVSGDVEGNDPVPVADEAKKEETCFDDHDKCNVSVDDSQSVDFGDKVLENVEGSDSVPVGDEVKGEETDFENHDSGNASVDGCQTADGEDDVAVGVGGSSDIEVQNDTAVGSVSDDPETQEVLAHDNIAAVEVSLSSNGDDKALPLDDAMDGELTVDSMQQDLPPVDGEAEGLNSKEVESEAREQSTVDPVMVAEGQALESLVSEAAGDELDQSEKGVKEDHIVPDSSTEPVENHVLQTVSSEDTAIQDKLKFAASGPERPASVSVGQPDESEIESESVVEESVRPVKVDAAVKEELDMVDESKGSELVVEVRGIQEASAGDDVSQDQTPEQTDLVDEVDKEIGGSQEASAGEDVSQDQVAEQTVEDATSLSKSEPVHDSDMVDAGSCLRYENISSSAPLVSVGDLPDASDFNISKERRLVDDESSVVDDSLSGSADDISEGKMDPQILFGSFKPDDSPSDVVSSKIPLANGVHSSGMNHGSACAHIVESGKINEVSASIVEDSACAQVAQPEQINEVGESAVEGSACPEVAQSEQINEVGESTVGGSEAEIFDDPNVNPDLRKSRFYWLIKVPYFGDEKLKEQLKQSSALLKEKTRIRDSIILEIQKKKASVSEPKAIFEAAKSEEKAARELASAKKRELDPVLSLVRLADQSSKVDSQIRNLEYTLNHVTVELREERNMIRELRQLKQQRDQLSRSQHEFQQALDHRDENEERLKVLQEELNALNENFSKSSRRLAAAREKFEKPNAELHDLEVEFVSAKRIQKEAYEHEKNLKRRAYEKNKYYYKYKDALKVVKAYADAGKAEDLERYCINHVEEFMERWNKNDEFRKEYVRNNTRNLLWRVGTLDGRRLGPDEKTPTLANVQKDIVNSPATVKAEKSVSKVERDFPVLEATKLVDKSSMNIVKPENKAPPAEVHQAISKNSSAEVSGRTEAEEDKGEPKLNEEENLTMKAEQLRKQEEEAARLKEKRRMEEKIKAQEALERKKKLAEKAQARAEMRALKEAEEKEKEREKRAKKKERKKGLKPEITETDVAGPSEPSPEAVKGPEVATEKPATAVAKRPSTTIVHNKLVRTSTPIPPALRNKGRRRLLHHWPYALFVLFAVAVFFLGDLDFLKHQFSGFFQR